jgi:pyrroline-5-carboxylate reductase
MGTALMKGARAFAGPKNLGFSDVDISKAKTAAASIGGLVYDSNIEALEKADFVFLAVKPQILKSVLEEITSNLKERLNTGKAPVLVSMAPGWTIEKIQEVLTVNAPLVRIMPNTPALISKGLICLCHSPEVQPERVLELEKILGAAGLVEKLEEKYFDAITGLCGSGPAFVYMFIEALSDAGVRSGLPRDKALVYASQMVLGSAAMVLETKKHPGELKDMVCSPGGTTIAGVAALEKGCFRGTVMSAVEAAWQRAVELGL